MPASLALLTSVAMLCRGGGSTLSPGDRGRGRKNGAMSPAGGRRALSLVLKVEERLKSQQDWKAACAGAASALWKCDEERAQSLALSLVHNRTRE